MTKKTNVALFNFYKREGLRGKTWGLGWPKRREKLLKFSTGKSFLDVGCAEGLYLQFVSEKTRMKHLVGLEISRSKLLKAKKNVRRRETDFINASWDFLPIRSQILDTVMWFDGFEHSLNPYYSLQEIGRITRKNLIICVPTSKPLLLSIEYMQTKLNRFLLNVLGKPFRGHLHTFTFSTLQKLLNIKGFQMVHASHNIPSLSFWKQIKLLLYCLKETITRNYIHTLVFNSIFVLKR